VWLHNFSTPPTPPAPEPAFVRFQAEYTLKSSSSGRNRAGKPAQLHITASLSALRLPDSAHRIKFWERRLTTKEETRVALTCPSCGNDQNFLVKTLQMHIVHVEDSRVEVSEEGRPYVQELLCDECETALNLDEVDEAVRKELLLTLGAR
jgi:hypothetical protein